MLLQLRRRAQRAATPSTISFAHAFGQNLRDELRLHLDESPLSGVLHVLEGPVFPAESQQTFIPTPGGNRGERGDGGYGKGALRESVHRHDEVGLTSDEVVGQRERVNGAADEEGVGRADDVIGVLEEQLPGRPRPVQQPNFTPPEDQLHDAASAVGKEAGR